MQMNIDAMKARLEADAPAMKMHFREQVDTKKKLS
jgi:hypothetical protein